MSKAGSMLDAMGVARDAFAERTALITGAARGIGEATARCLAQRGAHIIIVDLLDAGERVAAEIREAGGRATFFRCDITDVAMLEATLDRIIAQHGAIDLLVNNAGTIRLTRVGATSVEDLDHSFAANLRAPFIAMRKLLPGMLERRRGAVVNLTALEGAPFHVAYCASKAGLRSMTMSAARELSPDAGVSIFAFLPGAVDTEGLREIVIPSVMELFGMSEQQTLAMMSRNPGYTGLVPVEDCAAGLAFVLAHAPEYHGQVADPFEPLMRYGFIGVPEAFSANEKGSRGFLHAFAEVNSQNRELEQRIKLRTRELAEAHGRSEALLLNILPSPIADRLKSGSRTIADRFEQVTVMFADLVDFTPLSAQLSAEQVVHLLDEAFSAFDDIAKRLGLEKIKTIGDCYMLVGGLPEPRADHANAVARAALELPEALHKVGERAGLKLRCRIGLHSGPVVAGVIGKHKFIYDLWGDTVNTASRMESHGQPGKIHCTDAVRQHLAQHFLFEDRGEIEVKGKGRMRTYFLTAAQHEEC